MSNTKALAYIRTSSLANADGDSTDRQADAIAAFATGNGFEIVGTYADVGVSGATVHAARKGYQALLAHVRGNGVRVVIVESADRYARDLMVQEAGIRELQTLGVKLMTAGGQDLTDGADKHRVFIRQILGSAAELNKAEVVARLKRGREASGNLGGIAIDNKAVIIARARELHASGRLSLAEVGAELAAEGFLNTAGRPFAGVQVSRWLKG